MIYLYLFALIVGGILLGASVLLGGHGGNGGEADVGHDAGHAEPAGAGDPSGFEPFLVALMSARFWTFFAAFFGLTGVVMHAFDLMRSELFIAPVSIGMGVAMGALATWTLRTLANNERNSATLSADYIGKTARVLVPVAPGKPGKVRLEIHGSTVDLLAESHDDKTYDTRDEVLIIEIDGARARVRRAA